jgi:hypothetical protein
MNCFEKLKEYIENECEPCRWIAKILDFKQLPENVKYEADFYDKDKDLLLYCEKCKWPGIIKGDKEA